MVVIEFGFDRTRSITHYQKTCIHLGSQAAMRDELHLLKELGLVLFVTGERHGASLQVKSTQKLVERYSIQMPRLAAESRKFMQAREASR